MNTQLELYSPFPPEECAKRISGAIDSEKRPLFSMASLFGSHPVIGRVDASSLRLRKRIRYNNSFQSILTAGLRPEGSGTAISGEFAMRPFVRVFMTIWFTGAVLIGGTLFIGTVGAYAFGPPPRDPHAWLGAVIPIAMIVFGIFLVRFGRYLARHEARFLTDFLKHALDASDRSA